MLSLSQYLLLNTVFSC